MAIALRQLVLKVHSRCDLACDHCYVYEHGDSTWASLPKVISEETADQVARRFAEYAKAQKLEEVLVILHGGEPLLAGARRLRTICERLVAHLSPVTSLDLRMHTNAVQLNRDHLRLFDEFGVKIGISLDGDRAANDRHRLDRRGRSSYDRVLRAVELLREEEFRHLYLGLLCTVDIANDPLAVLDALTALSPPRVDFLLPHATWDHPPDRKGAAHGETPYADWLLAVFDRWDEQGQATPVRLFESVLSTLRGGPSLTESLGLAPSDLAVVETDGSFEQADSLKTAYDGAAATGYDVFGHGFQTLAAHPGVLARQSGVEGLADECRSCPVVASCGGGLYAHRYRTGTGFGNPSVYCEDLKTFIEGVARRITRWEPSPVVRRDDELACEQSVLDRTLLAGLECDESVWEAFTTLDASPASAELDALLSYPYVRSALLAAAAGHDGGGARLGATAVAAALRSGTEVRVSWQSQGPRLHLPSFGTLSNEGSAGTEHEDVADEGPVEVVTHRDGRTLDVWYVTPGVKTTVTLAPDAGGAWRPLTVLGDGVLLDDADPYRDCFPVPDAGRLDSVPEREGFVRLWKEARSIADRLAPGQTGRITAVTPLRPGAGVCLGRHGEGALGVGVDTAPEELALGMLLRSREARLRALRECTDLTLVGSPAGDLLDDADRSAGEAAFAKTSGDRDRVRAGGRAALDAVDPGHLTGSGHVLAARLRAELGEPSGG